MSNTNTQSSDGPTADFTYTPSSPAADETITFDASSSSDPDGDIVYYRWFVDGDRIGGEDGEDGGGGDEPGYHMRSADRDRASSDDQTIELSFATDGERSVKLEIKDNDDNRDSTSQTVNVGGEPPTADFTYTPNSPATDETVTFDASLSSDPDGDIDGYAWYVDGEYQPGGRGSQTYDHPFATDGEYTIKLTVEDNGGNEDSTSQTVSVGDVGIKQTPTETPTPTPTEAPTPTPTETPVSTSEATSTPTPTKTSTSLSTESAAGAGGSGQVSNGTQRDGDITSVLLGLLGLGSLGGAGAWWISQKGDTPGRDADTETSDSAASGPAGESPESTVAGSSASGGTHTLNSQSTDTIRRDDSNESRTETQDVGEFTSEIPGAPNLEVNYDSLTDKNPIGAGGNADVTKAIYSTPDGTVPLAIKEPRLGGTIQSTQVNQMLDEAETWQKLDSHDHIVDVVDFGGEPLPWIAMEYMGGGHLGERSGEMDLRRAVSMAIAITGGVRHAHRRGVAHLDLKPENILFRSVEDSWDIPKVGDWGLSRHLLDNSKSVRGLSPQYAAPEQFDEDFGPSDDITDIYQLGAVFYELVTGEPPFEGNPATAMHKVLNEQPTPPSEVVDVPEELDNILLTALAKQKSDRYRTIEYLEDALLDLYDRL